MTSVTRGLAAGVLFLMMAAAPALGQDTVVEVDWDATRPLSGSVEGGRAVVDGTGVFPLVVMDAPALGGGDIVLSADVAWEGLTEPGYLELWVVFDDGRRFFSRSLDAAAVGLLRDDGASDVELPFFLDGSVPDSLELNAVLPGGGHLEVGAVTVREFGSGATFAGDSDGWWSTSTGGAIGAVAGSAVGLLGAVLGGLASRLRARSFVLRTLQVGAAAGLVAAAAGLYALAVGQPYEVWFVLVLIGAILASVFGGLYPRLRTRYEAAELERIRAYDLV